MDIDRELTNPYLAVPRDKDELRQIIREIMEQWPETKGYHVLVGSDPEEFGLPTTDSLDGWSTIFPTKRILYVTGMALWAKPAIMALVSHEIGHIVGGHTGGESEIELENHYHEFYADEFAFENVKHNYGRIPATAALWLLNGYVDWFWEHDSLTHPCNRDRWARLACNGYVPHDYLAQLEAMGLETEGDRYARLTGNQEGE